MAGESEIASHTAEEMRARGMTHGEIVPELQVSRTSITSDNNVG